MRMLGRGARLLDEPPSFRATSAREGLRARRSSDETGRLRFRSGNRSLALPALRDTVDQLTFSYFSLGAKHDTHFSKSSFEVV